MSGRTQNSVTDRRLLLLLSGWFVKKGCAAWKHKDAELCLKLFFFSLSQFKYSSQTLKRNLDVIKTLVVMELRRKLF